MNHSLPSRDRGNRIVDPLRAPRSSGLVPRALGLVGGVEDHVHILASLRPVHCIADILRDLKKESSMWAKENFDRRFTWQEGYAAFTVSPTATDSVRRYIATQETHHRKRSFVDELRELLNAAGIEFDEKYLL